MSARRSGLGRGLDALLGAEPEGQVASIEIVAIDQLTANPMQPRSDFDEASLAELAESIRAQGLIQPIVAARRADGTFAIIAGERRWRAARSAGLEMVPVAVREVADDQELLELALVENLQRSDLNPVEEAEAYEALRSRFGLVQKAIAERVGKSRTAVTNTLRLLRLPREVQDLVRSGQLTAGQARPLLGLGGKKEQVEIARRAVLEGLTARALERMASEQSVSPKAKPRKVKEEIDVNTRSAEEKLTRLLRSKVEIRRRGTGGHIVIRFHSEDELMGLFEALTRSKA